MNIMVKRFIHKKIKDNISPRRLTILKNPTVEKVENIVVEEEKMITQVNRITTIEEYAKICKDFELYFEDGE